MNLLCHKADELFYPIRPVSLIRNPTKSFDMSSIIQSLMSIIQ
jgi:hypothetical protein